MIARITGLIAFVVMSSFFSYAQDKQEAQRQAWLTEADTLAGRQDFKGAIELYNKIVESSKLKTDDDYQVLYNRAYCYFALNEFGPALRDISQYLEKFPEEHALLLRIYINQGLGDPEGQLSDLNTLMQSGPGNPELLRWRVSVLMDLGKNAEAQKDLHTLLTYQPDPELQLYLGLTYYNLQQTDSAFMEFDKVIASNPDVVQSYLFAGSIAVEEGAYDLALRYLNDGLKQEPQNTTLLFYKGVALVEKKNTTEGCRCLSKAFNNGFDDAADYLKEYCYGVE